MTYDEISNILTIDNLSAAFDWGVVRAVRDDDDTIQLRFCHTGDPDGENSYFSTDLFWEEWRDEMTNDECIEWARNLLLGLVEDDPETYEDEVSFYATLIEEAAR